MAKSVKAGARRRWLPWTTNHLIHNRCLEIAKEARESGKFLKVRIGSTIIENGEKYSKVFLLTDATAQLTDIEA